MEFKFLRVTVLGLFIAAFCIFTFWRDVVDKAIDTVGEVTIGPSKLPALRSDGENRVKTLHVERERNNNRHLKREILGVSVMSDGSLKVSVRIETVSGGSDYPDIRIIFYDATKKATRYVDMTNTEYQHGKRFQSETVSLRALPNPGEKSLDIRLFYRD